MKIVLVPLLPSLILHCVRKKMPGNYWITSQLNILCWSKLAKRALFRQSVCTILTATGKHVNMFSVLLWHTFYFCKLFLTQIQKYQFLLLWNGSMQLWLLYTSWYFYFILQGQQEYIPGRIQWYKHDNALTYFTTVSLEAFLA